VTDKLARLMEIEGYDDELKLFAAILSDAVSPGICTNSGCDYTTEVEPDQDRGYCEACRSQTVRSALILAGLI
jgi:hypothetical protein